MVYGSGTYGFAYDALGRLVRRTLNGNVSRYYIYDGERIIIERGAGGGVSLRNVLRQRSG